MPDLRGRSAREAAIASARRGLIVELHGSGHVTSQIPEPGTEIEAGMTCVFTLGRGPSSPDPSGVTPVPVPTPGDSSRTPVGPSEPARTQVTAVPAREGA